MYGDQAKLCATPASQLTLVFSQHRPFDLVELEQLQARLLHYSDKFNLAGTETKLPSLLWNGSSVSSYFKDAPTMYLTAAAYLEMGRATGLSLIHI